MRRQWQITHAHTQNPTWIRLSVHKLWPVRHPTKSSKHSAQFCNNLNFLDNFTSKFELRAAEIEKLISRSLSTEHTHPPVPLCPHAESARRRTGERARMLQVKVSQERESESELAINRCRISCAVRLDGVSRWCV